MVKMCCVKECKESWSPSTHLSFFAFPFNNEEMKAKWLAAAPGYKALSKHSSICSNHFLPADYNECAGKRRLKKNAVPSIFGSQCPNGCIVIPNSITIDEETCGDISDGVNLKPEMINFLRLSLQLGALPQIPAINCQSLQKEEDEQIKKFASVSVQTCPRLSGPSEREKVLQHKIRTLQNRLRRREKMIMRVKELVADLKKSKSSSDLEDKFLKKFTKFDLELFKNEANNNNVAKNSKTYTREMKEFAKTLYSYSPRAYRFVRDKINLPHTATLRRWIAESVSSTTKENETRNTEVDSNELEESELTEIEKPESTEMEDAKFIELEESELTEIEEPESIEMEEEKSIEIEEVEYDDMQKLEYVEVEEVEYEEVEEVEYDEVDEADNQIKIEEIKLGLTQENLVNFVPVLVALPVSVSKTDPSHETVEKPCVTTISISSPKRSNSSAKVTLKR